MAHLAARQTALRATGAIAPQWVESIRWSERKIHVALTQANFKEAPAFDPSVRVNRQHEEHLYDFHGREHYWK